MDLHRPPPADAPDWHRRLQTVAVVVAGALALAAFALHALPLQAHY